MPVAISNPPRNPRLSRALLSRMKNAVLGKRYELSVAFVDGKEMRGLNRAYRGKDPPTDILTFPLGRLSGEIILCLAEVKRRARSFGRSHLNYLRFLVIHGLLHLKGITHGGRMERQERIFRKRLKI